ncbi:hypothetical protein NP493_478g01052 [Ridgeia piscesae]|uniref:NAD(+) kinase n=1 Tax=Ridgeia piscesae TaxID=27915 RepID=A0AAD9KXT1_RIDPI|nr:hypothetical protein NP493_478g01052 [Ridgeia piscesae]
MLLGCHRLRNCACIIRNFSVVNCRSKRLLHVQRQSHLIKSKQPFSRTNVSTKEILPERDFKLERVILMRKVTRYEYERQLIQPDSEEELKNYLISKGSDYDSLLERHTEYFSTLESIQAMLQKHNIEFKTVKRFDCDTDLIKWADAIFTAGGDGMFLMASSKVKGHDLPVIGINTDPIRSEGRLCLSKQYSIDFDGALDRIINGEFRWIWRKRIRLTMSGKYTRVDPVDLQRQCLLYPEMRFMEHVKENEVYNHVSEVLEEKPSHILPICALNEVFIGESLSARVSFYEVSIDGSERVRQKSSGITTSTGTGSTSWFFNINHIPKENVSQILSTAKRLGNWGVDVTDDKLLQEVTDAFNYSLKFDPEDGRMAYTVRDPIAAGIFRVPQPKGFCQTMNIKSRMWDGWLVIDGGVSFQFNDGAVVELSMHDEDALCGVAID